MVDNGTAFGTDNYYMQDEGCGHELLMVPFSMYINPRENPGLVPTDDSLSAIGDRVIPGKP